MSRGLNGKYDVEVLKKEIKDEVTHILYDQTKRTPIVIPVINEIGLRSSNANPAGKKPNNTQASQPRPSMPMTPRRKFPERQVPDTEANDTKGREAQNVPAY